MLNIDFSGKSAIVTGGGGVILRGIARVLCEAGAKVWLADYDPKRIAENEAELKGMNFETVQLDVTDSARCNQVIDDIAAKEDLYILVNGAGVCHVMPYMEGTEEQLLRELKVNVVGMHNCTQAALRHMLPKNTGRIINIGSGTTRRGSELIPFYGTTKTAVWGFTQAVALNVAKTGITVNTICPGIIDTPPMRVTWEGTAKHYGIQMEDVMKISQSRIPQGRFQTGEDIGGLTAFLCSKYADSITGQAINVDGAMNMN